MNYSHTGPIRLLILDVDGVMTDGRLWFGPDGEALKVFHVRDGVGIKALRQTGVEVAIVSGRRSCMVERRAQELGIVHVLQGVEDKAAALDALMTTVHCEPEQIACLGDDTPDLAIMTRIGLPIAVADAHPTVRATARIVTQAAGGQGAVREVCDLLISAYR